MKFTVSLSLILSVFLMTTPVLWAAATADAQFSDPGKSRTRVSSVSRELSKPGEATDLLLVHGNSVEKVMLGKSMKEVYSLYPAKRIERVLIYDAKGSYEKIEILSRDRAEVLFFIEPDCSSADSACIIKRINITSSLYHTRKNVRVGKYYVDLVRSGEKVKEITWFEGNLVVRGKDAGVSYVLLTNSIPKPWYHTMDQETLPDSTKIIGMMITGKELKGMSFQEVDSTNKKNQADLAIHKADLAIHKADLASHKADLASHKIKTAPVKATVVRKAGMSLHKAKSATAPADQAGAGTVQASATGVDVIKHSFGEAQTTATQTTSTQTAVAQPGVSAPASQLALPAQVITQPATTLPDSSTRRRKATENIILESRSDTTKRNNFPDPSTIK